jgi:RimJ/RimL family protein N-acetyltransferase
MNSWLSHPTRLNGDIVCLVPLQRKHIPVLEALARDPRIWEFYPVDGTKAEKFQLLYETALSERRKGNQYPFAIQYRPTGALIGSTRYLDIQPAHRKMEIGWTWLHPDFWGTAINLECKLLLLTHCFETLHAVRVTLKTDARNLRSRQAIQKIGGTFEGILRQDMIRDNLTLRDSCYFSLLDREWEEKKARLTALYRHKRAASH